MKVVCIEKYTPRSDGVYGGATDITVGKVYEVAEVVTGRRDVDQYSIINDKFKLSRYNQCRFVVVDHSPVPDLRTNFNHLTLDLRTELKALKAQLKELAQ